MKYVIKLKHMFCYVRNANLLGKSMNQFIEFLKEDSVKEPWLILLYLVIESVIICVLYVSTINDDAV